MFKRFFMIENLGSSSSLVKIHTLSNKTLSNRNSLVIKEIPPPPILLLSLIYTII
jgi:hypothetical protein